jgi:hypothetical protein
MAIMANWKLRKVAIIGLAACFFIPTNGLGGVDPASTVRAEEPAQARDPQPGVDHVDRLDLGELHVGAIAEAELYVTFHNVTDPGLEVKVETPPFASVKIMRVFRRGHEQPGVVFTSVILSMQTNAVGKQKGEVKVRLGDRLAKVPFVASVVPPAEGLTKVLVVSSGFGSAEHDAEYYRPWFNLVREAKLDVGYLESLGGMDFPRGQPGQDGLFPIPRELARYDVILVADGGIVHINNNTALLLMQLADSGKRVIITACPAMGDSVLYANRIFEPLVLRMVDHDIETHGRRKPTEAARLEVDELLTGVRKLALFRPGPIHLLDSDKAKILAYLPDSEDGFVAVSRKDKGEVVAVGLYLVASFLGDDADGTDNAVLLRNLLTKPAGH